MPRLSTPSASTPVVHRLPAELLRRPVQVVVVGCGGSGSAIAGGLVLSTRGGDFDLRLGQDMSIGYLGHNDGTVRLYLQETFTFLLLTTEAAVALSPAAGAGKGKGKG